MANWRTGVQMKFSLGLNFLTAVLAAVNTDFSKAGIAVVSMQSQGQAQTEVQNTNTGVVIYTWEDIVGDTGGDLYPI